MKTTDRDKLKHSQLTDVGLTAGGYRGTGAYGRSVRVTKDGRNGYQLTTQSMKTDCWSEFWSWRTWQTRLSV